MENLENLWGCLPAIRIASPHFGLCIYWRRLLEGLWENIGVSSIFLPRLILECMFIGKL